MDAAEIAGYIGATNRWRDAPKTWQEEDWDLRAAAKAPFSYWPRPLSNLLPGAMYLMCGPRRVGKSVELKRRIADLIDSGVDPKRIFHAACDGWLDSDLRSLATAIDRVADPSSGPRYVLLDEVTAVGGDWVSSVKWLRDNSSFRHDCLVLTGSSAEQLAKARKQFAGRRGEEPHSMRTLLPMGFRAFTRAVGAQLPDLPRLPAPELLSPEADGAFEELRLHTDALIGLWEQYLQVGGFPRAVADWVDEGQVTASFVEDLWDVIHGDALVGDDWSEAQSRILLDRLSRGLGSPLSVDRLAREVQGVSRHTVERRLRRLEHTFIAWRCPQGDGRAPILRARQKLYFTDPLLAHIASIRWPGRGPDPSQMTEQQVGMALLRSYDHDHPGRFAALDALMYQRSATGSEIDFVGPALGGRIPVENKYSDGPWLRASQTARKAYAGRAILASRGTTDRHDEARAVPAPALAYLLDLPVEVNPR